MGVAVVFVPLPLLLLATIQAKSLVAVEAAPTSVFICENDIELGDTGKTIVLLPTSILFNKGTKSVFCRDHFWGYNIV